MKILNRLRAFRQYSQERVFCADPASTLKDEDSLIRINNESGGLSQGNGRKHKIRNQDQENDDFG